MEAFTAASLTRKVEGLNLRADTLGGQLSGGPQPFTLVAFLRHYGCMFVREMVRDVKWAATTAGYPNVLLVGQGDLDETRHLLDNTWPEAPIVCDPSRELYEQMGLARGTIYQMFGPAVWACSLRASVKGSFPGRIVGDPWLMPGAFLVDREGQVRWQHEFRHQGDHPDWAGIPSHVTTPAPIPPGAKLAASI